MPGNLAAVEPESVPLNRRQRPPIGSLAPAFFIDRSVRITSLQAELVKFAGGWRSETGLEAIFLDFVNSLLTKILKVYVDLRRFYYADDSQR